MDNERLILRIPKDGCHQDIISALLEDNPDALPFVLPPLVSWPRGARACSERAMLLMKAGLLYLSQQNSSLKSKNQKQEALNTPHNGVIVSDRRPVESVKELKAPESPKVAKVEQVPTFKKPDFDTSLFQ